MTNSTHDVTNYYASCVVCGSEFVTHGSRSKCDSCTKQCGQEPDPKERKMYKIDNLRRAIARYDLAKELLEFWEDQYKKNNEIKTRDLQISYHVERDRANYPEYQQKRKRIKIPPGKEADLKLFLDDITEEHIAELKNDVVAKKSIVDGLMENTNATI